MSLLLDRRLLNFLKDQMPNLNEAKVELKFFLALTVI